MPLEAVLLDLDGTLVDSLGGLHAAAATAARAEGLPVPPPEVVRGFVGHGVPALTARLADWAGAPAAAPRLEAAFRRAYDADPVSGTTPLPGARDLLARLAADGVPAALVTNKPEAPTRTILAALGLGPFACVVGGDTLARRKPDPLPLRHALAALGSAPARAVMVGDGAADLAAARAVPMRCAILRGGYGDGAAAARAGADMVADTLEEVGRWLAEADLH